MTTAAKRLLARYPAIDALTATRMMPEDREVLRQSGLRAIQVTVANTPPFSFNNAVRDLSEWHGRFDRYRNEIYRIADANDFDIAAAESKIAVMLGFQAGEHIEGDRNNLDFFYRLGIRQIQLTYNSLNDIGAGCTERNDPGLSHFGVAVVERMNALGMVVDLSHCGSRTTLDAIAASHQPVLISHSNCRAINNHPRCKSDEEIRALAEKGGVIGLTTVRFFVSDRKECTADDFLAHVEHVAALVGPEHIAIGSDSPVGGWLSYFPDEKSFDEFHGQFNFKPGMKVQWPPFIPSLDGPDKFLRIADVLLARGFSDEEAGGILGGNLLRCYKHILSERQEVSAPAVEYKV